MAKTSPRDPQDLIWVMPAQGEPIVLTPAAGAESAAFCVGRRRADDKRASGMVEGNFQLAAPTGLL